MGGNEQTCVRQAFASNWLSTVGPNLAAFEREFEQRVGLPSVALASGTAALNLGLRLIGAGATVFENMPPRVVAYGTPARVIRAREPGEPYLNARMRAACDQPLSESRKTNDPSPCSNS
jgi:hypothetical protein